ncbi:MAG TPA: lysylphosphatidylglycerol synthase transmembrane domain-containing protein [Burkholderiales bacterium]
MKTAGRIALGVALLVAVVWYVDPAALARQLAAIEVRWFIAGVAASVVSNIFSAARWAAIARGLGLKAPLGAAVRMYFRGMTMNVLLPGATVSGDLLRGYQLAQQQNNPLLRSGLSVLLDRLSGLWILCACSLFSLIAALAIGLVPVEKHTWIYLAGLVVALALPWLPLPVERAENARRQALQSGGPILRSIWLSVLVQVFSAMALWFGGFAAGVQLSYPVMLAAAAPIFIMGAMPLGWGGFGARELSAVLVLGALGVAPEQATVTALLYGISMVLQGVVAAPLFLVTE